MSIPLYDDIYAIVRNKDGNLTLKVFPLELDFEPSDYQLRQFHNYSVELGNQYASNLAYLDPKDPEDNQRLEWTRGCRRKAIAFKHTTNRIKSQNEVVAISHRYGGWTTFKWNYNDDISFEVYSNFGYGSASRLLTRYFFKGIQLTPYSDYVRYRFADFSELKQYTYRYRLKYSEWQTLMNDTLSFYNAVCKNQENEVFHWLRSHLNRMIDGLRDLINKSFYVFCFYDDSADYISGFDLDEVKAKKIGGAIELFDNIKILPHQINPQKYINALIDIIDKYQPKAIWTETIIAQIINDGEREKKILSDIPEPSDEIIRKINELNIDLVKKKKLLETIQEAIQKINQFKEVQNEL